MENTVPKLTIWKGIGLVVIIALWFRAIDGIIEYSIDRSDSTWLVIAGIVGFILTTWIAYKAFMWMLH